MSTCLLLIERHAALGTAFHTAIASTTCCFELFDSFVSLLCGDTLEGQK